MIGSSFLTSRKAFYLRMAIIPLAIMPLTSCTGLIAGVGATVGAAAVQEGGLSRAASDARIQADINERWFAYDVNMFAKLDLTVNQGRVLITGVVQDPEQRVQAVRLAWQPSGVVQVINEIKVAESEGLIGFAKDAWLSGKIRAALIMDRDVESINYSVDTVRGSVYLMGFAQNQGELNHVIEIVRNIGGVKRVVSYVKLVGTPENREGAQNYQMPYDSSVPPAGEQAVNGRGQNVDSVAATSSNGSSKASSDPVTWNNESVY